MFPLLVAYTVCFFWQLFVRFESWLHPTQPIETAEERLWKAGKLSNKRMDAKEVERLAKLKGKC